MTCPREHQAGAILIEVVLLAGSQVGVISRVAFSKYV